MGNHVTDESLMLRMIEEGIKAEIGRITQTEIESAKKRIEEQVRGSVDKIALKLLTYYAVERSGRGIVITVKKEGLS